jgi:2'-5' RNA ligase
VAWLEFRDGVERVTDLGRWLEAEVASGIEPGREAPRRSPGAHLTVARRADAELIGSLHGRDLGPLEAAWMADRVALVRSHLGRGGATYEVLHEAALAGPGPGAEPAPPAVPDRPG